MAIIMEWDDRFDTGVPAMNEQHKKLIDLMNELYDAGQQKAAKPVIVAAIEALEKWTVRHFQEEEAFMESISYPDLEVHRGTHRSLLKTFLEYKAEAVGGNGVVPAKFFHFLKFWLSSHICGIDAKYGKFYTSKSNAA